SRRQPRSADRPRSHLAICGRRPPPDNSPTRTTGIRACTVWSQTVAREFVELAVGGLAAMYPAFDLERDGLLAIMGNSAPASSLAVRPQRAIWVTRVRRRREDRTSISSHPLADLGRVPLVTGVYGQDSEVGVDHGTISEYCAIHRALDADRSFS